MSVQKVAFQLAQQTRSWRTWRPSRRLTSMRTNWSSKRATPSSSPSCLSLVRCSQTLRTCWVSCSPTCTLGITRHQVNLLLKKAWNRGKPLGNSRGQFLQIQNQKAQFLKDRHNARIGCQDSCLKTTWRTGNGSRTSTWGCSSQWTLNRCNCHSRTHNSTK